MSKNKKEAKIPKKKFTDRVKRDRHIRALDDSITNEYRKADSIYTKIGDTQGVGLPDDLPKVRKMEERLDSLRTAAKKDSVNKQSPKKKK